MAVVWDESQKQIQFHPLYLKNSGLTLFQIEETKTYIKNLIQQHVVVLSDFKSYVSAFDLDSSVNFRVYDVSLPRLLSNSYQPAELKKLLLYGLKDIRAAEPAIWQLALARAQLAYRHLERVGFQKGYETCHSTYETAYTGRSRCLGDNIQGYNGEEDIKHVNPDYKVLICFDWRAADLRVASLLSGDPLLSESFVKSDPYTALEEALNDKNITREQCKLELFRGIYSMDYENPAVQYYEQFAAWIKKTVELIQQCGYSESILGRRFYQEADRTDKSVFNAQIQGSVAHAMHNVLYRVYKLFADFLMADIHDSLVLATDEKHAPVVVREVSQIMLRPFDGLLESNPVFPLRVSIGPRWKAWKPYREYR